MFNTVKKRLIYRIQKINNLFQYIIWNKNIVVKNIRGLIEIEKYSKF